MANSEYMNFMTWQQNKPVAMNSNPKIGFTIFGSGSLKKCHDLSWLPIVYDAFFGCMSIKNYDWGFFSALDNPFFTCEFLEFRSLVD